MSSYKNQYVSSLKFVLEQNAMCVTWMKNFTESFKRGTSTVYYYVPEIRPCFCKV
jgi:hypothetical protein